VVGDDDLNPIGIKLSGPVSGGRVVVGGIEGEEEEPGPRASSSTVDA
jgi:hypothetical protein